MRLKAGELLAGLKKAYGIVNDTANYEQLQSFYFKPAEDKLFIAGSDGNITYLSKTRCVLNEEDIKDQFILPSKKLFQFINYCDLEEELIMEVDETSAVIKQGNSSIKITRLGDDYLPIPFEALEETEFDDSIIGSELISALQTLLPIVQVQNLDNMFKVIYLDGEKAFASDSNIISVFSIKTGKRYVIPDKAAYCLVELLKDKEGEMVNLKYIEEDTSVLVKTKTDVFTFRLVYEEGELDVNSTLSADTPVALVIDKKQLEKALQRVILTSEDNHVKMLVELDKSRDSGLLTITSQNSLGEESVDKVKILKSKNLDQASKEFSVLSSNVLKLVKSKQDLAILRLNFENNLLKIMDPKGRDISFMPID